MCQKHLYLRLYGFVGAHSPLPRNITIMVAFARSYQLFPGFSFFLEA